MSKYKAKKTTLDGITFHSKAEANRYLVLKNMQREGVISNLKLQPEWLITWGTEKICKVILDFAYIKDNRWIYEDVKGVDTALSKLKRKLVQAQHGIGVTLVMKNKIIYPKMTAEGALINKHTAKRMGK